MAKLEQKSVKVVSPQTIPLITLLQLMIVGEQNVLSKLVVGDFCTLIVESKANWQLQLG